MSTVGAYLALDHALKELQRAIDSGETARSKVAFDVAEHLKGIRAQMERLQMADRRVFRCWEMVHAALKACEPLDARDGPIDVREMSVSWDGPVRYGKRGLASVMGPTPGVEWTMADWDVSLETPYSMASGALPVLVDRALSHHNIGSRAKPPAEDE